MWTLFPPGNFWVFIIGAIVCSIIGTAILYRYKNNWLNYVHAVLYFSCAVLFVSEYTLQQAGTYEQATTPHLLNGLFFYFYAIAGWLMNYWYINPLAKWKYKKQIDIFLAVMVLAIPILISLYFIITDQIFDLANEKINGLWKFKIKDSFAAEFHRIHTFYVVPPIMMFSYIYGVVFAAKKWRRAIISIIAFIGISIGVSGFYDITMSGWQVSSAALPIFIANGFFSWFILDYKLENNYDNALKDLLNSISDLIIQTDENLFINTTNSKLDSYFNPSIDKISVFLSKNSHYNIREIEEILKKLINQETESEELTLIDKNDKTCQFKIKVSILEWRGKKSGYSFLLHDMTLLKEKEQLLKDLNITKDRIFTIIGHDMRKPVLAFRGITKKVNYLLENKDYQTLNKLGNAIEQEVIALHNLTDNILSWALLQKKILPNNPNVLDLDTIVAEVIKGFENRVKNKNIHLNSNVSANAKVLADVNAMSTILRNLVDNAIKYTPENGKVSIQTVSDGKKLNIQIKNNGPGISSEKIQDIFLLQKNKSTKGTKGEVGTGLGLHIVHELVKINKGTITVESGIGTGTIFNISMPI